MLLLITVGYTVYQTSINDRTTLGIAADRQNYTPMMSSTVGIGLTPVFSVDNKTVDFIWHTDYGHFVSWGPPDFKVYEKGPDVISDDSKIYWSYSPDDMDKEKPPVHITLTMVDKASGKAINKTGIDIGWINRQVAVIKE
jgi:hypothetical protein